MNNVKRIKLDNVLEWFEKAEIVPEQDVFFDDRRNCGCVLSAKLLSEGVVSKEDLTSLDTEEQEQVIFAKYIEDGYSHHYLNGLVSGFDGICDDDPSQNNAYKLGQKDGVEAQAIIYEEMKK